MTNRLLFLISRYGTAHQTMIAIEEMGELIQALVKYRRNPCEETRKNIIEEIADVQIMIEQLKLIHSCKQEVGLQIEYKLERQIERARRLSNE